MTAFAWFIGNAAGCAVNAAMFADSAHPINLGVAVFCGLVAILFAVTA